MGSNPTPGTLRIHTTFGRLILAVPQHEPKLQTLLLAEPRHRADRSPEDLPLVLWIAMPQHRSKIVGVLPQPPDRREARPRSGALCIEAGPGAVGPFELSEYLGFAAI